MTHHSALPQAKPHRTHKLAAVLLLVPPLALALPSCGKTDRPFDEQPEDNSSGGMGGNKTEGPDETGRSGGSTALGGGGGDTSSGGAASGGAASGGEASGGEAPTCDPTEDDVLHCGACDNACPAPSLSDEEAVCVKGECAIQCKEGSQRCSDDGLARLRCVEGSFQYEESCEFVCVEGRCDGSCKPGDTGCSGHATAACDEYGAWEVTSSCDFVCIEKECSGECVPETPRCEEGAREICSAAGLWEPAACASGTECILGSCLKSAGEPCDEASECANNICTLFYQDTDGDGYGGANAAKFCGATPPAGYRTNGDDCCDTDAAAKPGQTLFFTRERTGCGGFDFDCADGGVPEITTVSLGCGSTSQGEEVCNGWENAAPACGQAGQHANNACTCPGAGQGGCPGICATFTPKTQACK